MKIAHVVSTFPPHFGGMGQVCFEEAASLARAGHEVTVFTLRYSGTDYSGDKELPFKVVRLWTPVKYGDAGFAPQLFFKLRNFDLVHLHYPFYGSAQCIWLAKKISGQKYVVTYHMDAAPVGLKKIFQKIYDFLWARAVLRGAGKVLAVDREYFGHSAYGNKIRPENVEELWNGVDTEIYSPGPRDLNKLNLPQLADKKILLFVGNPLPLKRLDLLLQALQILRDPSCVLIVVGGGYDLPQYKILAKHLGLEDKVFFVGGEKDPGKLAGYCRAADVLVVSSETESFSLAALYALSCGRPVIGSDIPGLRGRLANGQDSLLFKSGSADDLAAKIRQFFVIPATERMAMGERGRQKVLAGYSWDKHLQKLLSVYHSV